MRKPAAVIVLCAVAIGSCSQTHESVVDCEWFGGVTCWSEALQALQQCVPHGAVGSLDPATGVCLLPDDTAITFLQSGLHFEVRDAQQQWCGTVRMAAPSDGWSIETREGLAELVLDVDGDEVQAYVVCDGERLRWLDPSSCPGPGLGPETVTDPRSVYIEAGGESLAFECIEE